MTTNNNVLVRVRDLRKLYGQIDIREMPMTTNNNVLVRVRDLRKLYGQIGRRGYEPGNIADHLSITF